MEQQLATLLTVNIIMLSFITMAFLIVLVAVLLMLRKTLIQVQTAVDEVQGAAMVPLTSAKHIFSDLESFVSAFTKMFSMLRRKKKS